MQHQAAEEKYLFSRRFSMKRRGPKRALCAVFLLAAANLSCGTVKNLYIKKNYDPDAPGGVKKIRLYTRRREDAPGLSLLISVIARDHLKFRKNYDIRGYGTIGSPGEEECDGVEGMVIFTLLEGLRKDDGMSLHLRGELRRCPTREILWSAESGGGDAVPDEDISGLVNLYRREFGETARTFAAPGYLRIREILDTLPEPFSGRGLKNKVP